MSVHESPGCYERQHRKSAQKSPEDREKQLGTFLQPFELKVGGESRNFRLMALGDFDADGHMDLAINGWGDDGISLAAGQGDGSFGIPVPVPGIDVLPNYLTVKDLDGDGVVELFLVGWDSRIRILLGGPDFIHGDPIVIETGLDSPRGAALVDLNGDDELDLVYQGEDESKNMAWRVHPGIGEGELGPATEIPPVSLEDLEQFLGDLNGDGIPDTVQHPEFPRNSGLRLLLGRGDFTFQEALALNLNNVWPRAFLDVDGDGFLDFIGDQSGKLLVARGSGKGTLENPIYFSINSSRIKLLDDVPGFLAGSSNNLRLIPLNGDILLGSPRTYLYKIVDLDTGDFDRDGREELVAYQHEEAAIRVLSPLMNGDVEVLVEISLAGRPISEVGDLRVHDVDGDGLLDIAFLTGETLSWFPGRGDGSFDDEITIADGIPENCFSFHDLDEDGDDDLLISSITIFRNLGRGNFGPPISLGPYPAFPSAVGDFNGDGHLDILHGERNTAVALFAMGGGLS